MGESQIDNKIKFEHSGMFFGSPFTADYLIFTAIDRILANNLIDNIIGYPKNGLNAIDIKRNIQHELNGQIKYFGRKYFIIVDIVDFFYIGISISIYNIYGGTGHRYQVHVWKDA